MNTKLKILIIDDDPYSIVLIEEYLKSEYLHVYSVKNGKEAVDFCQTQSVDLILTDILMPVMNGIDAFNKIKIIQNNVRVIAQTAYTEKNKIKEIKACGIDHIIFKPFLKQELLEVVESTMKNVNSLKSAR